MSELGYYMQLQGGVIGQPDGPPLADIEANQEATALLASDLASSPGAVPQCYLHPGGGNLPKIGWTCQNATGPTFPPYNALLVGHIPDWTSDVNPAGAGAYDQTQVVDYGDYNPANVAPLGDGLLQYDDSSDNPNTVPMDQGSIVMDYEY